MRAQPAIAMLIVMKSERKEERVVVVVRLAAVAPIIPK